MLSATNKPYMLSVVTRNVVVPRTSHCISLSSKNWLNRLPGYPDCNLLDTSAGIKVALRIMAFRIMTHNIFIFSKMTLSTKKLYVTLSLNDIQHNNALPLCSVSHFIYYYAECHYAECRYADCSGAIYKH